MKPREEDMTPELHEGYRKWKALMDEAGIPFILTCVLRTKSEQEALYAQGRKELQYVNQLRRDCGMSLIGNRENSRKVTWTNNSKHFGDMTGKSRAFDFAIAVPGKGLSWDVKWDADHDGVAEYLEAARLAKAAGLDSGAFWSTPDFPHIQVKAI